MNDQRGFKVEVHEGTYDRVVTVWVDADEIEMNGNSAIENAAWKEWRQTFGPSIGMAYTSVKILEEIG